MQQLFCFCNFSNGAPCKTIQRGAVARKQQGTVWKIKIFPIAHIYVRVCVEADIEKLISCDILVIGRFLNFHTVHQKLTPCVLCTWRLLPMTSATQKKSLQSTLLEPRPWPAVCSGLEKWGLGGTVSPHNLRSMPKAYFLVLLKKDSHQASGICNYLLLNTKMLNVYDQIDIKKWKA